MIDVKDWLSCLMVKLEETFDERLWFVGLQGSYARGEATPTSDIDVVVILKDLTIEDLSRYGEILDSLPHRELSCGFIAGLQEIVHWEPSELFEFVHDTTPFKGTLVTLLERVDDEAIDRAIKQGACAIYHACVHNMLHEKSDDVLKGLYKQACFVVQAITYQQMGRFVTRHADLVQCSSGLEHRVVSTFLALKKGESIEFQSQTELLFQWSRKWIGSHP